MIEVGDVVMFVPRMKEWNNRWYMIGKVVEVIGDMVKIVDVTGERYVEYQRCVLWYCAKEERL
jgi:hypothetical protein